MTEFAPAFCVVKVGGSLFDLPDLANRLSGWLAHCDEHTLLLPGGGASVEVIRQLDAIHRLGEERGHWLALAAMRVNAHFLASLLPQARVVDALTQSQECWDNRIIPVLDALPFCEADAFGGDPLPKSWNVTSDSIAAKVALQYGAAGLVLLKSVDLPDGMDWREAARREMIDAYFPSLADRIQSVRVVNLRRWQG